MTIGPAQHGVRRLLVDAGLTALAIAYGLVVQPAVVPATPLGQLGALEIGVALFAISGLWWLRRASPEGFAVLAIASTFLCDLTGALPPIALAAIALTRGAARTVIAGIAMTGTVILQVWLEPVDAPLNVTAGTVVVFAAAAGWATAARHRRRVVELLRAQVRDAAEAAERRAEEARRDERMRIARDIHDTVAHRMSLLAIQGSALAQRVRGSDAEVLEITEAMRSAARASLEDLRWMMDALREPGGDDELRPAPSPADLPQLIEQARAAHATVVVDVTPDWSALEALPAPVGHVLYRIVQESLTNSRKHGDGRPVRIEIRSVPDASVEVTVAETGPPAGDSHDTERVPGSGRGLIGLRERVRAVGGSLEHGRDPGTGSGYRVHAVLPWMPRTAHDRAAYDVRGDSA